MPTKILLADDSITIQKIVHQTFEHEPVELTLVGNGDAAIRKMHEILPDLILADIFMPGKNGYEVCEYVKQQPELASVPVILLVGAFEPFDEKEAARVLADDHLKKPFAPQMLVETIRKYVTLEPAEKTVKLTTWPEPPEETTPAPPSVPTHWHAEQTQVIPLTPPTDFSRAVTRPIVDVPFLPPPPAMPREEPPASTSGVPFEEARPLPAFSTFIEETESPLEISHVHQSAVEVSPLNTQPLVSEPEAVPTSPRFDLPVDKTPTALEQEPTEQSAPVITEEPAFLTSEPANELEPFTVQEASAEHKPATLSESVAEPSIQTPIKASAEPLLEPTSLVAEGSTGTREPTPASMTVSVSGFAAETTVPGVTDAEAFSGVEPEESGPVLTDEFREFQRELVRHAPDVLPRLTEEPLMEPPPMEPPPPVESPLSMPEEVMGPPAPPALPEETLIPPPSVEPAEIPVMATPEVARELVSAPQEPAEIHLPASQDQVEFPGAITPPVTRGEVSQEMIDAIVQRVIERMSSRVVEEIAWEVVPEIAETLLRKNILEKK
ncbi:MAG: response regulator [Terriglobia bacterium]